MGTRLLSPWIETGCITQLIKNPLPKQRVSLPDHYPTMVVHVEIIIMYNVWGTWPVLNTSCTCNATEDTVRIVNWFYYNLNHTNYNHSQLSITLCHIYTAYNHTPSWLQSLITLLHRPTSQLSITVSNYHRLYIFTLRNSRRELTRRIHCLRLTRRTAT
jgi:hypothetical protein